MSAYSLSSSGDEGPTNFSALAKSPVVQYSAPTSPILQSNASIAPRKPFQSRSSYDRPIPSSSSRVNGIATPSNNNPPSPSFQRSRTYSQPYISDLPHAKTKTGARPKVSGERKSSSDASRPSPRPSDVKPTRIPVASRQRSTSSSTHSNIPPAPNGNGYFHGSPEPYQSSDLHIVHETRSINSSRSNLAIPSRQSPVLLHEPAPFGADSVSSASHSPYDEVPPRSSNDSEERPFEHWYRGEVSRNGGVGELRVGRRQEMLEIANYGHKIKSKGLNSRAATQIAVDQGWRQRKRAGSVSGVEETVRERDSLHLDDEGVNEISRVLDEHPPTDLDGEGYGSEDVSLYDHYYLDSSTASAPQPSHEHRSTTPTPSLIQRSSSRQQNLPPTRIPGPSRQSSESRAPTPTSTKMVRETTEPPPVPSTSAAAVAPSQSPSPPSTRQQQQSKSSSTATPTRQRGRSPGSANNSKSRMAAAKATRAKKLATKKEMDDEANRRSVAYYPTPADGDELMDAIPSWTEPVPKEGNWDDVSRCLTLSCPSRLGFGDRYLFRRLFCLLLLVKRALTVITRKLKGRCSRRRLRLLLRLYV